MRLIKGKTFEKKTITEETHCMLKLTENHILFLNCQTLLE